jgi:hypothetical protein
MPFRKRTSFSPDAYLASHQIRNLLHWMRKYTTLIRFLDMPRYHVDEVAEIVQSLHSSQEVVSLEVFQAFIKGFQLFVGNFDKQLKDKSKRLDCAECVRLDEALVCYENYAYHASVIMAVSAVEGRITELIRRKQPRLFKSEFSKATLGQLISIFEPDQYKDIKYIGIKKLMPNKHRPLVALLNQYRVFSAHPKGELNIATYILPHP